mmetsp:Transcript_34856/g.74297  ORF Transcript_34856/g.74297 Transcript_34856/m.74297 type:complete len:217 (-) Transcript_34856:431-1081(-)
MRPLQCSRTLVGQCVPSISVEVIIPPEHDPPRFAERQGRDTALNFFALKFVHLPVASHVEQPAGRVVTPRPHREPVREERDRVDVLSVPGVGLDALPDPEVPDLRRRVHAPGDEDVVVLRTDRQAHYVPRVVREGFEDLAAGDVPVYAARVPRGGEDVSLVHEAAAAQVPVVRHQLLRRPGVRRLLLDVVDRADVVQSTAGDEISLALLEGARHDP